MTGRIQPTTLGPSAKEVIRSRIGRARPKRAPSAAAIATTGPSAVSPERRSTATCREPQARRSENRITPRAHAGIAHEPNEASQFGVAQPTHSRPRPLSAAQWRRTVRWRPKRRFRGIPGKPSAPVTRPMRPAPRRQRYILRSRIACASPRAPSTTAKKPPLPATRNRRSAVRRACCSAVIFSLLRTDPKVFR